MTLGKQRPPISGKGGGSGSSLVGRILRCGKKWGCLGGAKKGNVLLPVVSLTSNWL